MTRQLADYQGCIDLKGSFDRAQMKRDCFEVLARMVRCSSQSPWECNPPIAVVEIDVTVTDRDCGTL